MKTETTFIFIKGQLKVIPLPEKPDYEGQLKRFIDYGDKNLCENLRHCMKCRSLDKAHQACPCDEAVAYARAHPVDVRGEDVEQIRKYIWSVSDLDKVIEYCDWVPQDHTEYKLEGVVGEISNQYCSRVECSNHESGCNYIPCKEKKVARIKKQPAESHTSEVWKETMKQQLVFAEEIERQMQIKIEQLMKDVRDRDASIHNLKNRLGKIASLEDRIKFLEGGKDGSLKYKQFKKGIKDLQEENAILKSRLQELEKSEKQDKIENNDCICSCGGGENNGHDWNCPWQEEES